MMFRLLANALRKRFGIHVCEEFSQWKVRESTCQRAATQGEAIASCYTIKKVRYTRRWQERQCTLCGKTEILELQRSDIE